MYTWLSTFYYNHFGSKHYAFKKESKHKTESSGNTARELRGEGGEMGVSIGSKYGSKYRE